jgi:hypothetical protein
MFVRQCGPDVTWRLAADSAAEPWPNVGAIE